MYEQNVISVLYAQHTDRYVDKHIHLTIHFSYLTHKPAELASCCNQEWYQEACRFMKRNWRYYKFHFSALGSWCRLNDQPTVLTDFGSLEEASPTQPMPSTHQPHQPLPQVGPYPAPSLPAPSSWEAEHSPGKQSSQRDKNNSDWFCLITGEQLSVAFACQHAVLY